MFSVLNIEEQKQKFFRKRKCRVESLLSPVKGAAPFKVINAVCGKKGVDWQTVAAAAGCSARSMLVPIGVNVPPYSSIQLFEPQVLPLLIMLNTAAVYLGRGTAAKNKLLIIDRNAVLPDYIERIVMLAAHITVATDCPEKYYPCMADIMEKCGAGLRVCLQPDSKIMYDVAVTYDEAVNAKICLDAADVSDNNITIPDDCLRMCPEKIDSFLFTCALFECSGLVSIGELTLSDV